MRLDNTSNFDELRVAILDELTNHDWSQPFQASVDELGLALGSHVGLSRIRNEDRVAVARVRVSNSLTYTVALLCDGVGGSEAGDVAAAMAISAVISELCSERTRRPLSEIASSLTRCADEFVRQELGGRGTTTLSMFLASSVGQCVCASVGDSRVYSWDPLKEFAQVTTDDTVENELKALPGDHAALLKARGLKGRLSQAIGETGRTGEELRVQVIPGDLFRGGALLGSDGLWKIANDFNVVMLNTTTAVDAVRRSINLANWVGGVDNASVVAIDDLARFSQPERYPGIAKRGFSITLWMGATKFKFIGESGPQRYEMAKPENMRRRPPRPKKSAYREPGSQLDLPVEKASFADPKPVIEVTLGSGSAKEEGRE